jgi:hypothetical protein
MNGYNVAVVCDGNHIELPVTTKEQFEAAKTTYRLSFDGFEGSPVEFNLGKDTYIFKRIDYMIFRDTADRYEKASSISKSYPIAEPQAITSRRGVEIRIAGNPVLYGEPDTEYVNRVPVIDGMIVNAIPRLDPQPANQAR